MNQDHTMLGIEPPRFLIKSDTPHTGAVVVVNERCRAVRSCLECRCSGEGLRVG